MRNVAVSYSSIGQTPSSPRCSGKSALQVSGFSEASAQAAAEYRFLRLLDNSPSMALPATQRHHPMQNPTPRQTAGGCAFACHQASTNTSDTAGNPCTDGTTPTPTAAATHGTADLFQRVPRRTDRQLRACAQQQHHAASGRTEQRRHDAAPAASATAQSSLFTTPPQYRFSIYSMDSLWSIGLNQLMSLTTSYTSAERTPRPISA